MIDFIERVWRHIFSEGSLTFVEAMIFFAGYMVGIWNERMRTKSILFDLSELLKKNKIKTDIYKIELDDDSEK